jgi:hypothetical protein
MAGKGYLKVFDPFNCRIQPISCTIVSHFVLGQQVLLGPLLLLLFASQPISLLDRFSSLPPLPKPLCNLSLTFPLTT